MRVLMLGWEFPPHIAGGLGTACLALTRALARDGVEVVFVVPHRHGDEEAGHLTLVGGNDLAQGEVAQGAVAPGAVAQAGGARSAGGRVTRRRIASPLAPYARPERLAPPGAPPRPYGPDLFDQVVRYADAVRRLAREHEFDVVHAHDWMTFAAGTSVAREAGVPLVAHVHSLECDRSPRGSDPRIVAAELEGFRAAARILCVSRWTAQRLVRTYRVPPARVEVVHNALPDVPPRPSRRPPRRVSEPVVLFLGRVTAQKGPETLLAAARRVVAVEPQVTFVIAGGGDLLGLVIERAAALGLARHVAFTGFLGSQDVERAYAAADVFVLPSVSEPFGLTALEAAARGVPVILSRQSGAAEVLTSALRFDCWDVQDLADKILAVIQRAPLARRLAREGARQARALTWARAAREVRRAYAEVCA